MTILCWYIPAAAVKNLRGLFSLDWNDKCASTGAILIEYARTYSQWIIHEKEDADLWVLQAQSVDRILGVNADGILEVEAFGEHSNVLRCDSRKLDSAARNDKMRDRSNMNLEDVNREDSNVEVIGLEVVMLSNENLGPLSHSPVKVENQSVVYNPRNNRKNKIVHIMKLISVKEGEAIQQN
ncbi:hypothetical protein BCR33DRAFT_850776 [Rhizoclosmatium globosum]|uniref:Uncharacterized protein n=1 Tax=Rhizoclosmatium globosum TaxID=329046 RepID=A0A1Y2CB42_9FUNG|nr:hypothetical protein BCR33DRAFT_850776 [Rhizoclosmatium globosum]|eukprot:ORY44156.1 hypothetical protein BCR33DRAFT_850776 [Rhizoclosmatium globosum]